MEGDCEAVALIADLFDEIQRRRPAGQHDRRIVPGDEHLLIGLGEATDRDVEAELLELSHRRGELGAAAIDHQQVGPAAEPLVGHAFGGVATSENLGHGDEIVGLIQLRTDLEATVLAFVGLAVRKYDHGRDGEGAMQGRDVETLDAHRRRVQGQRALELQ